MPVRQALAVYSHYRASSYGDSNCFQLSTGGRPGKSDHPDLITVTRKDTQCSLHWQTHTVGQALVR